MDIISNIKKEITEFDTIEFQGKIEREIKIEEPDLIDSFYNYCSSFQIKKEIVENEEMAVKLPFTSEVCKTETENTNEEKPHAFNLYQESKNTVEYTKNIKDDVKVDISEVTSENLRIFALDSEQQQEGGVKSEYKSSIINNTYTCQLCSYQANDKTVLNLHISSIHNKLRIIIQRIKVHCRLCDKLFTSKQSLEHHMQKNHKKGHKYHKNETNTKAYTKYTSNSCSDKATNKSHFDENVNLNNNKSRVHCQFCDKSFTLKATLDGHMMKRHQERIKSDEHMKRLITTKLHFCHACPYKTPHKYHLKAHINSTHKQQITKINCGFCDKSFTIKRTLDGHLLKNHKDKIKSDKKSFITSKVHRCKMCLYEVTYKSELRSHMMSVHNEQKFKQNCKFCDKSFTKKRALDGHLMKNHMNKIKNNMEDFITNRIYPCSSCSYLTPSKSYLKMHINAKHTKTH